MGAICGIVDLYSHTCNGELLLAMARATKRQGGGIPLAYINGGVALQQSNGEGAPFPFSVLENESTYTILFDGRVTNLAELAFPTSLPPVSSVAGVIIEGYIAHGINFFSMLEGEYSLAIYNERVKELLIVCGKKPIFYFIHKTSLIFSSDARAVLLAARALGGDAFDSISTLQDDDILLLSRLGLNVTSKKGK